MLLHGRVGGIVGRWGDGAREREREREREGVDVGREEENLGMWCDVLDGESGVHMGYRVLLAASAGI